jgi:hypothetical protein
MRQLRFVGLALAVTLAVGLQAHVGLTEQAPASIKGDNAFDALYFRSIGPATMSGRIADFAVYEANPAIYYVASSHGGVWKTTNHGTTWEPQLQDTGHLSTGSIAISQSNPDLVWVGTGESANRQSVSWGDGVYKSTDGGKTYTHMGLRTSKHITRIRIDPRNNDIVYVAATGSLWGPGGERGVYKTTDGGRNWTRVLHVDDDTGADELVMHPTDSRILYATMYQRRRTECCFVGGGPGGGIFKTTDGGENWTKLKGGPLDGPVGRIGLDIYRKRPEIMYALIEGPAQPGGGRGGGGAAQARRRPRRRGAGGQRRADRALPHRRCRRDVAEGEQHQSPSDVLQPGQHRPERSRDRVLRRRRPAPDDGRRPHGQHPDRTHDRRGSPSHLDQSGQLEPRAGGQRRRHVRVVRPGREVEVQAEPAARRSSTTSPSTTRFPTTSAAACRTTTAGAARAPSAATPASATTSGTRCSAATASSPFPIRTTAASCSPNRRTATSRASIASPSRRRASVRCRPRASRRTAGTGTRR